jgi:uncharacterized protein YqfB (UPF0267 family)
MDLFNKKKLAKLHSELAALRKEHEKTKSALRSEKDAHLKTKNKFRVSETLNSSLKTQVGNLEATQQVIMNEITELIRRSAVSVTGLPILEKLATALDPKGVNYYTFKFKIADRLERMFSVERLDVSIVDELKKQKMIEESVITEYRNSYGTESTHAIKTSLSLAQLTSAISSMLPPNRFLRRYTQIRTSADKGEVLLQIQQRF